MKLPSISYLFNTAKESLIKYPLIILSAAIATALSIYMIEFDDDISFSRINILITSLLGIPLLIGVNALQFSEENKKKGKIIANIGSIVLLILIYISLPNKEDTFNRSIPYIRYGIYNVIAHLFVAFAPFINSKNTNGFWNYNKTLFIRSLLSVVYSGFLYTGIALGMLAVTTLFDVKFDPETYGEIWVIIIVLFNTWFFVSGLPENIKELEEDTNYPKGLRIFSQYVLLSLLIGYLLILYAYGSKIIILWDWPQGIVAYMITAVAILGVFAFLLLYPYGKKHNWINTFSKGYYILLYPLIAILFIAIFMRVGDYAITINRYAIVLLGIWLTFICTYFTIGKKNIKIIPASLAILMALCSFGPWGVFSISERSQANRLKDILEEQKILIDGQIQNEVIWEIDTADYPYYHSLNKESNEDLITDSVAREIKSIVDYLDNHHGFNRLKDCFSQNTDSLLIAINNDGIDEASFYMETMGLDYRYRNSYSSNGDNYYYYATTDKINIFNFDYLFQFDEYSYRHNSASVNLISVSENGFDFNLTLKKERNTIELEINQIDFVEKIELTKFDLSSIMTQIALKNKNTAHKKGQSPYEFISEDNQYKLLITRLNLREEGNKIAIRKIEGYLLIKKASK